MALKGYSTKTKVKQTCKLYLLKYFVTLLNIEEINLNAFIFKVYNKY